MEINLIEMLDEMRRLVGDLAGPLNATVTCWEFAPGRREVKVDLWVAWKIGPGNHYEARTPEAALAAVRAEAEMKAVVTVPAEVTVSA